MRSRNLLPLFLILLPAACQSPGTSGPDSRTGSAITVSLSPGDVDGDMRPNWSPKAAAVPLAEVDGGLEGDIGLGSSGMAPFHARLEKSGASEYFDILKIDANRNGSLDDDEALSTEPNEVRYAMWSSFETVLDVPVRDSVSGETVFNPYPMSLWYVEQLREGQETSQALRFTRRGWMQGRATIDGVEAHVRLSESDLDGVFTMDDEWTLALPDSIQNLFDYRQDRPAQRHAWLGQKAYQITSLSPTGRSMTIVFIDPGVTRAKEAQDDDKLAVDRQAPHSGNEVAFTRDFAAAEQRARENGKTLFVDFDAVWCGPCKQMDEWVYTADSVEAAQDMISAKVDGDDFPEIAERFEVSGYPTMITVTPEGEVTGRLVGYQSVADMTEFLSDR